MLKRRSAGCDSEKRSASLAKTQISFCLIAVLALQIAVAAGQQGSSKNQEGFRTPDKAQSFTAPELLAQFSADDDEYTLGEGDEITVEVWDHPELSGKQAVGPDGRITLSQAGPIKIANLSREDAAKSIRESFSRYYSGLVVTVKVDSYTSNRVFVLGRVMKPGILQFETPPTLLEAVTRAGGLPVGGSGAEKAALARCAIFRGRDRVVWIELRRLLTGDNLALNIRLKRNDIVYIPDSDDQLVYVLGEVHTPGAYRLTPNMTFLDALSLAGGPTTDANSNKMKIVRPNRNLERDVSLKDLLAMKPALNISLNEGDIIYVPKRGLANFGYIVEKITPFTTLLLFGSTFGKAFGGSTTK
ncbi:MAG TPA: polysaccharide biosynthesis/export family protein [Blastocatellia bacterium]|nr:polysaccharide biosynthesis/export family protein [Blastocatellia bacterium]